MQSFSPKDLGPQKLHEHLLGAVAPRPIAFATTVDKAGNINLSPFSFFNCFGANPPTLIFSPARSGRTGATKHTHDNVLEVPECVVNIAPYSILYQMNLAAHMYPKGTNEFEKSGLTPLPSVTVKPPRVAECYVQMECTVKQVIPTGVGGGAGNLIICEVTMIHIDEKVLDETGSINPAKMDYIARLGKQFWCRVGAENIITIPGFKMANELGLGFDNLPDSIRHSKYLTGNEIAQIAALSAFPSEEEIEEVAKADFVQEIIAATGKNFLAFETQINNRVKIEICRGSLALAFQLLMLVENKRKRR